MTPAAAMDLSVVLCTRNRADALGQTLRSLNAVTTKNDQNWEGEFVVVDNGSSDNTKKIVDAFHHPWMTVRYLLEPNQGLAIARNRAVRETTGAVLLFTDDDMRFPDYWLERMVLPVLTNQHDAVRGAVKVAAHLNHPWMSPLHRAMLAETDGSVQSGFPYLVGANMALHRRIFDIGCRFDEDLGAGQSGAGEEIALSLQLSKHGFRMLTLDEPMVEHHPDPARLSRHAWRTRMFCEGRSNAILYRRYGNHRRRGAIVRLARDLLRVLVIEFKGLPSRKCPATRHELEQWRQLAFDWELIKQIFKRTSLRN